jgi:hypothetical protein
MPSSSTHILLLGNASTAEMRPVADSLTRLAPGATLHSQTNIAEAAEPANGEELEPDLIVVCQNWPDEFPTRLVQRLLARYPLARWICCYGVWCESDGRNRDVWPASVRVPARRATTRITHELAVLAGQSAPLPLTASRDEVFAYEAHETHLQIAPGQNATVFSPDGDLRRYLEEFVTDVGFTLDNATESDVVLFDADPWCDVVESRLARCRANYSNATIIGLMNLPHPEDIQAVQDSGADLVVPKLATQNTLFDAINTAQGERSA